MKTWVKEYVLNNLWFKVLSFISIALMIISFFLPPQGVIDPSVMGATGEIFAFAALGAVLKAMDKGKTVSMKHGETEIVINGKIYKLEDEDSSVEE